MKTRNGFVSNSSSCSYIIKINNSEACPTCGRRTPNIVDHIRNRNSWDDETSMQYDSKEDILADIDAEILDYRKRMEKYSIMKPNEVPAEYIQWGIKRTAEQLMEDTHKDLEHLFDRRRLIESIEGEVYGIGISYHDDYTNQIFQEGVSDGSIEVIEDHK